MAVSQKRKSRSYKVIDKYYNKAMRRAKKEGFKVANLVELFVISYANYTEIGYKGVIIGYDVASKEGDNL